MANTVNITMLSEGPKKAMLYVYLESDGNEGELVNRVILDPNTDFKNPAPFRQSVTDVNTGATVLRPPKVSILQIWTSAAWFDITFSFNGLNPNPQIPIARDAEFYLDFRYFGGLQEIIDVESPSDGKLMVSTKDFSPQGSNGFIILEIKKD